RSLPKMFFKEMFPVLRRFHILALAAMLLGAACLSPTFAQTATPEPTPKQGKQPTQIFTGKEGKMPTAEQVAETVVLIYGGFGGRSVLGQIRRNGVERGRVTRTLDDGHTEEISYEQRFVRGENASKDKIRVDQKMPTMEYALVFNEGRIWGIINGTAFTPKQDATAEFLSQTHHGIDALLRYKENGSTVALVGKEKQKGLDLWVVDLTDKDKITTRYYISANPDVRKTARVLWLEYEETPAGGGQPVKYRRTFHDYRYSQNTLVPFRSVLYRDDKQAQEARVLTVTYGVKMDETFFQNPEAAAN
ncbi:MAG TPA: hypothetical protein VJT82_07775, partial [Pyrinomonadaceae bacterium]|nr:hypothetical protein [Pyrinomonadaceae bacterium]